MMVNLKIESLKRQEMPEFWSLFGKILEEDFANYPPLVLKKFLTNSKFKNRLLKRKIWLGKNKKEIVGFLVAMRARGGVGYINWLGVEKKFRRQGVGKALVDHWEKWAKNHGFHKLRVQTSNFANRPFYEKLGFKLEGIKKNDAYGLDYLVFGKIIGNYQNE